MITQTGRVVLTMESSYDFINELLLSSQHEVLVAIYSILALLVFN